MKNINLNTTHIDGKRHLNVGSRFCNNENMLPFKKALLLLAVPTCCECNWITNFTFTLNKKSQCGRGTAISPDLHVCPAKTIISLCTGSPFLTLFEQPWTQGLFTHVQADLSLPMVAHFFVLCCLFLG